MFCKELALNKLNYSIFKTSNYDIQKHMILCTLIDESIIPGVGQWYKDTPGAFLWVL